MRFYGNIHQMFIIGCYHVVCQQLNAKQLLSPSPDDPDCARVVLVLVKKRIIANCPNLCDNENGIWPVAAIGLAQRVGNCFQKAKNIMDDLLQQGIDAFQNGARAEARTLLMAFVRQNPDSEAGWAWLFDVCDTEKERIDCLKQVVRINPHNENAIQALKNYTASKPSFEQPVTQPVKLHTQQPVIEKTSERDFKNDTLARKIIRFLLIFQVSALFIGIILTLVKLSLIAVFIAFLSLVLLLGALIWFYIHYQLYPVVQEKQKLARQSKSLQAQILEQSLIIDLTQQNREKIKQDEQAELVASLQDIQKTHIDSGLSNAHIADVNIPGIGPELKQRLVTYGFSTALSITPIVAKIEGFNPVKAQAILDWRARVYSFFDASKPTELLPEIQDQIKNKYQVHQTINDAEERRAQEAKTKLENTRQEIQPRIIAVAPFTFVSFLRYALGPKGFVAALTAAGLILSPICLGIIASFGAI